MSNDWDDCAMAKVKFEQVKNRVISMVAKKWKTEAIIGCIYGLYQDYQISEEQEQELYNLVDPDEKYNNCSQYWNELDYNNPLERI